MDQQEDIQALEAQKEIERILGAIKAEIPIFLYAQPGQNDVFTDTARQAIRFFRQLTDKIILREFNLNHESAKKWTSYEKPFLPPPYKKIRPGKTSTFPRRTFNSRDG